MIFCCFVTLGIIIFVTSWIVRHRKIRIHNELKQNYNISPDSKVVAFFHPYCNAGGGGERVLWTAIKCMLEKYKNLLIVIYVDNRLNTEKIYENANDIFGISIQPILTSSVIHFVPLKSCFLLSPKTYPILTLCGQAIGSIIVGLEAIIKCPPDIFIDTTGFAFTIPFAKWIANSKTAAYVHYPTISSDMISRVWSTLSNNEQNVSITYNNAKWIRNSRLLSFFKFVYYVLLTGAYKFVGLSFNLDLVMTNSSWTEKHIKLLWGCKPAVLYPPCPCEESDTDFEKIKKRSSWIMSVGQFRPEKNHELQIEAFHLFLSRQNQINTNNSFKLFIIGGCRDKTDELLIDNLKNKAYQLGLNDSVKFLINLSYNELRDYFNQCTINLHTMIDEHFGIGIVEGMAAGLITVAHNSGGPQSDIIGPRKSFLPELDTQINDKDVGVGFLASSAEEYADIFEYVLLHMPYTQMEAIQESAKDWVSKQFSEEKFTTGWLMQMSKLGL